MDKNVRTPQGSVDNDDGTDDAQKALLNVDIAVGDRTTNVQSPIVVPFGDPGVGVQHSIAIGCRQPTHFYELLMTNLWKLIVRLTNIYDAQKNTDWEDTTVEEMRTSISLCMQMSVVKLPHLKNIRAAIRLLETPS
ncbi:hypothetical protein KIN20_004338 [Parelaphostrongylus tenuis]|uniref:PiggyBac transposable element-derived protein domain-containing protein n=1 Tax=Parelaphostrongylus tenuis TaxID=148309 RepID=A0AAD5MR75_PARTN|nr:hypothetical protein KIN20_004338 [Parelaphostrongylus tenuis]